MKSTSSELHRLSRKMDKRKPRPVVLDLILLVVAILMSVLVFEVAKTFLKGALR